MKLETNVNVQYKTFTADMIKSEKMIQWINLVDYQEEILIIKSLQLSFKDVICGSQTLLKGSATDYGQ